MNVELDVVEKMTLEEFAHDGELNVDMMEIIGRITEDYVKKQLEELWDAKERIRCARDRGGRYSMPRRYMSAYEWSYNGFNLELSNFSPEWEDDKDFIHYDEFLEPDAIEKAKQQAVVAEQEAIDRQRQKETRKAAEKEAQERAEYERLKAKFEHKE